MLHRSLIQRQHLFAASLRSAQFGSAVQHSMVPREKDYYSIIGCAVDATPEQIKEAYRASVKMHHPDTSVGGAQPDAQKFRNIMEAYSVLSVHASRINYDLQRKRNPQDYTVESETSFNKTSRFDLRNAAGNTPVSAPAPESYAAERMAELKAERKKYNVNDLGYYRGGVPVKGRGPIRGKAIGVEGEFHAPAVHNFLNNYHQDAAMVTSEDAVKFKAYMSSDKYDHTRSRPTHPMTYDHSHSYMADRSFWGKLCLGMVAFFYAKRRLQLEKDRFRMWDRVDGSPTTPAHHFANRGGVLLKKQFAGFEKYHVNTPEMMAWYTKAYPDAFRKV